MNSKTYTQKELNTIESLSASGKSAGFIAETIGRSKRGIFNKCYRIGISFWPDKYKKRSRNHKYTSKDDQIVKALAGKKTRNEIGKIIGVSGYCIYERYKRMGISFRLVNEYHPSCKHSSNDVELIRQLYDEGISVCEIARKFEISHQRVSAYINYKSRKAYSPELIDN